MITTIEQAMAPPPQVQPSVSASDVPGWQLSEGLTRPHEAALSARGLDVDLLREMGVVSATPIRERSGGEWIALPFHVEGKPYTYKFRTVIGVKQFTQVKGKRRIFFNHDAITDPELTDRPLIITEGEMDCLAALTAGCKRVVSWPDGAALPPEEDGKDRGDRPKFQWLDAYESRLKDVTSIILAVDADEPGKALLSDLANKLGRARCKWVSYPEGCKDLNDVLMGHGPDVVRRCLESARHVDLPGLYGFWEVPPREEYPVLDPQMPGWRWKIRRGDFSVASGIPGSGKSILALNLACYMAQNHDWHTTVGSWEAWPTTDYASDVCTWYHKRPDEELTHEERSQAYKWMGKHFGFIIPPEDEDPTIEWAVEMIKAAAVRFGSKLVILDPWNELEHVPATHENMSDYTGYAIRRIKAVARTYGTHVMIVAHPRKQDRTDEGYKLPRLYDISGSAHWFNKADLGVIVHRQTTDDTVISVQKTKRHRLMGAPGEVTMHFDPSCNRYFPVEQDYVP